MNRRRCLRCDCNSDDPRKCTEMHRRFVEGWNRARAEDRIATSLFCAYLVAVLGAAVSMMVIR